MTPVTRIEYYLAYLGGEDVTVPVPITRIEFYLAIICGSNYELPLPTTRTEQYLYIIAGGNSEIPVPVTRIETYLASIAGMEIDVPVSITRTEYYLTRWLENSGWEYKTVTGSLLHITDAIAGYVSALSVAINPVQSLNGYDSPWPAGGGTNRWDEEWEVGKIDTSTGANASANNRIRSKNYIPVLPNNTYYFFSNNVLAEWFEYDANKNFLRYVSGDIHNATFTTGADCYYRRFCMYSTYGTTYNDNIAVNYPSTITTYSPYANICPISGWTEAKVWREITHDTTADPILTIDLDGTRYGGTLDVLTGVLTVDRRYTTIGAENVTKVTNSNYANFQLSFEESYKPKADQANVVCISSALKGYSFNDAPATDDNYMFANNSRAIRVKNTANAGLTSNEWKTLMADVQLCYLLATPITVQLTPAQLSTLAGENNVWADTGDITITYMTDGETETIEALNLLLGNRYTPAQTEDDVPDKEALQIITGGTR